MAYDEGLAQRLRELLSDEPMVDEKKMFGGLAFIVRGNMCCGVLHDELIVRVGPERYADAIKQSHSREFDFTGRPMRGFVVVKPKGVESDEDLSTWVQLALDFVMSLPIK